MSQALRKLTGNLSKSQTICIFINQLREKIGVMFGCMTYGTRVTLADGTQEKIGKIVNQRMPVEVLSYDPDLGAVVPKKVVNWFDNGPTDSFLQFSVAKGAGNGRSQFACTPNHQIRTSAGWKEAQELAVGDRVLQAVPFKLSRFQWEVLLGGLMGDGALSPTRSGHGARLRFGHGAKQGGYCDWKASLFANIGSSRSVSAKGAVFHDLPPQPELAELRRAVYVEGKKVLSHDYLKRLTPLSLAIWYMDDGGFTLRAKGLQGRTKEGSGRSEICIEAMESTSRDRLVSYLADTWDIRPKLLERAGKAVLQFPKDETAKLHALIAPFIHPSMEYKLLPRFRGRFAVEAVFAPERHELVAMPIMAIAPKPPTRSTHRFDIEVEGSHNYFVDGVMVHNSPETTPGGRALKFYSSVRNGGRLHRRRARHGSDLRPGHRGRCRRSQPAGEQALEIVDTLIRSGALDVVVIGPRSRARWAHLRKLTGQVPDHLHLHQPLREKIGVMRMHDLGHQGHDGTQEKIGKIVNQRMPVEVLSYDPDLGAVVPKKVVNWFDNGPTDSFLQFTWPADTGRSVRLHTEPPDPHSCRWKEQELAVGDRVLQAVPFKLSRFQWEVLLGAHGRWSTVSHPERPRCPPRFGHGAKQGGYCDWKVAVRQHRLQPIGERQGGGLPRPPPSPSWPSCAEPSTSRARRCLATTT